jgi:hypothetical protein
MRVVTAAYLEVWTTAGRELLALEGGQLTLGADPAADPTLSPLTADAGDRSRIDASLVGAMQSSQRITRLVRAARSRTPCIPKHGYTRDSYLRRRDVTQPA